MALISRFSSNHFWFWTILLQAKDFSPYLNMFNLSCIFGASLNLYHVRPGFGGAVIRTSWGCVSILLDFHLTSLLRYAGSGIFSFLILFSGSGIFLFSIFLDFHLTTLFRYAGSGIFPSDFPGQLCRAAVAILAKFCNCLLFFVYILFFFYLFLSFCHLWATLHQ